MKLFMAFNLDSIPDEYKDLEKWPKFSISELSQERTALFNKRYHAIKMYLAGHTPKEILNDTTLSSSETVRLLRKCLTKDLNGEILGFSGLVPYSKASYSRRKPIANSPGNHGFSGAFKRLLALHPVLADLIENELLKSNKPGVLKVYERKISYKKLHSKFLKKCIELGLESKAKYPFNTENLGYNSLASYANAVILHNGVASVEARAGDAAKAKLGSNSGTKRPELLPYERVECDAHKIDALFCILIPTGFGEYVPKILHRVWVIVIKDVATRAIIGYRVVFSKECNSKDVLKCIKHALTGWEKKKLRIPIKYDYGASLPSGADKKYIGAKWQSFSCDGAMANLATNIETKMLKIVGCKPTVHRRKNKDDRPFVERFFGALSADYFKRLPSTVGSKKEEYLRSNPELAACKYFIHIEELEDVIDVLLANYNNTPHSSLEMRSPLNYLQYLHTKNNLKLERVDQAAVENMLTHTKTVQVKGKLSQGTRPYINFLYSTYTSDYFRQLFSLQGKKIKIEYDPDDIRIVAAYKISGEFIGKLISAPPWNTIPHSVNVRSTINSLRKKRVLHFSRYDDPIEAYLKFCEEKIVDGNAVTSQYLEARTAFTTFVLKQRVSDDSLSVANDENISNNDVTELTNESETVEFSTEQFTGRDCTLQTF